MHDVVREYKNAQFIISSHSPILLGYPEAQIHCFDGGCIQLTEYDQLTNMQIVRRFTGDRQRFLEELFKEPPPLFTREPLYHSSTVPFPPCCLPPPLLSFYHHLFPSS